MSFDLALDRFKINNNYLDKEMKASTKEKIRLIGIGLLEAIILFLTTLVLEDTLSANLFSPLWTWLSLSESCALTLLVDILAILLTVQGVKMCERIYTSIHIALFIYVWTLYIHFENTWSYLTTHFGMDCWALLLASYPAGVIIGIAYQYAACKKKETKEEIADIPPIIIFDDSPITDDNEDEFRYVQYAQRIARAIQERKAAESYSIGITGTWGSGKTSMLNLVKNHLKKDKNIIIVEFNPRKSADVKLIQSDFLTAFCTHLEKYHSGASHIISDYMEALNVIATETIWEKVIGFTKVFDSEKSREDIERMLETIGKKIVVLIDDFDRLSGEEIMEVLKVIDQNGSFNHTVFISAYDKQYVNKVLNYFLSSEAANDYTDKYFNLELRLPDRKQFHKNGYLQRRLLGLKKGILKNATERQIYESLNILIGFIDEYLPTPRDIKRYLGLVMANYAEVEQDVSLRDFLLIGLVKYKYPEEYSNLYKYKYFDRGTFETSSSTNYILLDEDKMKAVRSFKILRILFPQHSDQTATDKNFGYKHISWKRSFDYYFFDQELGHVSARDLIPLATPNISFEEFRKKTRNWTTEDLRKDIADYVESRGEKVHSAIDFRNHLRLSYFARYLCPSIQLFRYCSRMMSKHLEEENCNHFAVTKDEYEQVFKNMIQNSSDYPIVAILLQDALYLTLKPGDEVDLIFESSYYKEQAAILLDKVLKTYHAERTSSEAVYESLKANVAEVYPDGTGYDNAALEKVRKSMVDYANLYFRDIVWHEPIANKDRGITIGFNKHLPMLQLFKDESSFMAYLREVEAKHPELKSGTNCLSDLYERIASNKFNPISLGTHGINNNISQGDFSTYNLIFEGER